jgi:predicted transcriptional regulator
LPLAAHFWYDGTKDRMMANPTPAKPEASVSQEVPKRSAEDEARLDRKAAEDLASGVGVPLDEAIAWVESWGTPGEKPSPKARKLT